MSTHSPIGASSADRWFACPGSVRLCEGITGIESEYAKEGTAAHEVAAECLLTGMDAGQNIGKQTSNGVEVTEEMADAVQVYLDYVRAAAGQWAETFIETHFKLSQLHPQLYGTNDAAVYDSAHRVLTVIDYKHGAGKPVEVLDNRQLKYYALGACLSLGLQVREVKIVIVQPRCEHTDGPIREQVISAVELLDWASDLMDAVRATEDPNAPLVCGDHCRWCPASAICPEQIAQTNAVAVREFSPISVYDPVDLANRLSQLDRLEAYAKAVRQFAYSEAVAGRAPPGYKLVDKRGNRSWIAEEDATTSELLKEAGCMLSHLVTVKLKSPKQIEDALPAVTTLSKKEAKAIVAKLCESKCSGTALVPDVDARPAIEATSDFVALE